MLAEKSHPSLKMNRRVLLQDLNPHLMCVLCGGYYVDATTIIECVHSFCRSCIVKHLESSKYCPICEVLVHKTKPLLNIRRDETLQDIVYKLVPGLFSREMKQRRQFYIERPHYVKPDDVESGGDVSDARKSFIYDKSITLSLGDSADGRPPWYLKCPIDVPIGHLKKLVLGKYGFNEAKVHVEIVLKNSTQLLDDDLTLLDISCLYPWRSKNNFDLTYSLFAVDEKKKKAPKEEEKKEAAAILEPGEIILEPQEKEVQLQITEAGVMSVSFSDMCPTPVPVEKQVNQLPASTETENRTSVEVNKPPQIEETPVAVPVVPVETPVAAPVVPVETPVAAPVVPVETPVASPVVPVETKKPAPQEKVKPVDENSKRPRMEGELNGVVAKKPNLNVVQSKPCTNVKKEDVNVKSHEVVNKKKTEPAARTYHNGPVRPPPIASYAGPSPRPMVEKPVVYSNARIAGYSTGPSGSTTTTTTMATHNKPPVLVNTVKPKTSVAPVNNSTDVNAKHKAIRSTPYPWRPVIPKEKLRPTLMSNSDEPRKPGKFFKMRNMPRFLGNPSSGVKPMYTNGLQDTPPPQPQPQSAPSTPPRKTEPIIRIDPKTLRPFQKEEKKTSHTLMTSPYIPRDNHFLLPDPKTQPYGMNLPLGFHASLPPSISLLMNPHQHFRNLKAREEAAKLCDNPDNRPSASTTTTVAATTTTTASHELVVSVKPTPSPTSSTVIPLPPPPTTTPPKVEEPPINAPPPLVKETPAT